MTLGRSSAFWAGNRYPDESAEPSPIAPLHDLPAAPAARFRALRSGLLELDGVAEAVRYMGATWRWAWEYSIGNRRLCWLHVVRDDVSATFTLTEMEEERLRKLSRLSAEVARAVTEGQRTGPVRWCWLNLAERRTVEAFLSLARRKAEWLAERPAPHRAPKLRARREAHGDEAE
jgi:hypothetical protein